VKDLMQTTERDARRTALVVDYDAWERSFTTEVLTERGYLVFGASNGASGLRLAAQHECDVILLDLALPELSGPEFLQQVKAADTTREIPVIVLGAESCGVICAPEGRVPKPLDGMRVLSEVARVLGALH
jgi:response regulator RpfG family c-di-GMP phosphodiesterase